MSEPICIALNGTYTEIRDRPATPELVLMVVERLRAKQ
jgi:xanthine dehydrogenase molybdopterin-binding subunit B